MSLEQTVDNLEIRYANVVTFVGTSNTMIDTTTGRIQTKGIQHNSNVITDVSGPHGRVAPTLKKYPEIAFEDTSKMDMGEGGTVGGLIFKQAGYTITASSTHPTNGRVPYRAFNGDHTTGWICASSSWNSGTNVYQGGRGIGGYDGEWIKLELPHKIKVETMYIEADLHSGRRPLTGKLLGSDDDSSWAIIKDLTSIPNQNKNTLNIGSTVAYKYIAFLTETIPNGHDTVWIDEIEYYGYEEYTPAGDHSVDTTFMSRFNNPQLTGVQVLVDGATGQGTNQISGGPDPSGNQSTMTSHNKYWTLNGTLTSNLSVEANTFLEGDQPHAVSVWFNSSNLEANVSNTCVFSVSDQEKLDSVNLDLQSNTWHNLTYAYQGEGGSRVTYLDGRKVAEDQAEDTFGEYPPFAMTGYSQGGYVVSASSELASAYRAHEAFNGTFADNGDAWLSVQQASGAHNYSGGSGAYVGTANLGSDSGGPPFANADKGEWLKLEMPYKFVLDYITICGSTDLTVNPKNWKIYGSNDDKNWDVLLSKTNTVTVAYNAASGKDHTVGATKAYKYFALVVTATNGFIYYTQVAELEYYGHRENDLVRLPDPTNVLKYPHIAMTGPAQRGYVASASSEHSNSTFDGYNGIQEGKLFDDDPATFWHAETNGTDDHRYDGTADAAGGRPYGAGSISNFDPTGINIPGEWVQLEFPHKLKISKVHIRARSNQEVQAPKDFAFYGSDTGSAGSWTLIQSFTGEAPQDDGTSYYAITSNPAHYKYILMLITRTVGTTAMSMAALQYYGTGVDSVPIQIGGGNIDKVANFRVYDKFIDQNQALEIWDAQKDEFGRAKSSMTLQKGRLGIGTDEPQGRLAVLDEPSGLEEFPPRAMTAGETYFEGHGVFKASSEWNRNSDYEPFAAFNKYTNDINAIVSQDRMWWSSVSTFTGNPGVFNGDTTKNIGGYTGVGLKLEMPYSILCNRIDLYPRNPYGSPPYSQNPRAFKFIASKDNEFWDLLHEETNFVDTGGHAHPFRINTTQYYKYFAIVVTGVAGNTTLVSFVDLQFFGTREQGQSVLHDGQLTLTKSLTVPRIGPALDADDTPRRDRLVVEYNTSTNPTFEGAVRDTSGRGFHGALFGGAYYDANEKALRFDGSGDYTEVQLPSHQVKGEWIHSVSCWVKADIINGEEAVWNIGDRTGQASGVVGSASTLAFNNTSPTLRWYLYNADAHTSNFTVETGQWYHITCVYTGGVSSATSQTIYVNGVEYAFNIFAGTGGALNFDANRDRILMLGRLPWGTASDLDGSISNFKLWDTALTAEEVKTLYDMGRTGSVANPQPLHIATPLYAPGTIVQVEQSIKRDDSSTASTSVSDIPGLSVTIHPKFATSKILVSYQVNMGGNYHMFLRTKRTQNGTTTYVGNGNASGNRPLASSYQSHLHAAHVNSMNMEILDPANGTDPITYQLQFWVSHTNYTAYINRSFDNYNSIYGPAAQSSSITVKEVCQ